MLSVASDLHLIIHPSGVLEINLYFVGNIIVLYYNVMRLHFLGQCCHVCEAVILWCIFNSWSQMLSSIYLACSLIEGRASGSPTMDLFITLLSLGRVGYCKLLADRKEMYQYLLRQLALCAERHNQRLLKTKNNPISIGEFYWIKLNLHYFCFCADYICVCIGSSVSNIIS